MVAMAGPRRHPSTPLSLRLLLRRSPNRSSPNSLGPAGYQELVRLTKRGEGTKVDHLVPVAFVPLVGEHGWRDRDST
jgi:hypothetical protein